MREPQLYVYGNNQNKRSQRQRCILACCCISFSLLLFLSPNYYYYYYYNNNNNGRPQCESVARADRVLSRKGLVHEIVEASEYAVGTYLYSIQSIGTT